MTLSTKALTKGIPIETRIILLIHRGGYPPPGGAGQELCFQLAVQNSQGGITIGQGGKETSDNTVERMLVGKVCIPLTITARHRSPITNNGGDQSPTFIQNTLPLRKQIPIGVKEGVMGVIRILIFDETALILRLCHHRTGQW